MRSGEVALVPDEVEIEGVVVAVVAGITVGVLGFWDPEGKRGGERERERERKRIDRLVNPPTPTLPYPTLPEAPDLWLPPPPPPPPAPPFFALAAFSRILSPSIV